MACRWGVAALLLRGAKASGEEGAVSRSSLLPPSWPSRVASSALPRIVVCRVGRCMGWGGGQAVRSPHSGSLGFSHFHL